MDLYQPMYLDRPTVELEQFAGLRPQMYKEGLADREEAGAAGGRGAMAMRRRMDASVQAAPASASALASPGMTQMNQFLDPTASVVSQASAGQIGELFQYTLPGVTLARQSSAMIPIVTDPVEIKKLSIYNPSVHAMYPLTGARITNTTGKNLLQGPITVFAGGSYAGDAQINNVPPGQARLISYGIDLQVLVDSTKVENNQSIVSGKVVKGMLELSLNREDARTYLIKSKSPEAKTVLIEAPRMRGYDLFETVKPDETTDTLHRFQVDVKPAEKKELVVKQRQVISQSISVIDSDTNSLLIYARNGAISQKVRDQLSEVVKRREGIDGLRKQIEKIDGQFNWISQDQGRIRENMSRVERNTDYYKRLLSRLNEQEDMIDKGRQERDNLAKQLEEATAKFQEFVSNLNVE